MSKKSAKQVIAQLDKLSKSDQESLHALEAELVALYDLKKAIKKLLRILAESSAIDDPKTQASLIRSTIDEVKTKGLNKFVASLKDASKDSILSKSFLKEKEAIKDASLIAFYDLEELKGQLNDSNIKFYESAKKDLKQVENLSEHLAQNISRWRSLQVQKQTALNNLLNILNDIYKEPVKYSPEQIQDWILVLAQLDKTIASLVKGQSEILASMGAFLKEERSIVKLARSLGAQESISIKDLARVVNSLKSPSEVSKFLSSVTRYATKWKDKFKFKDPQTFVARVGRLAAKKQEELSADLLSQINSSKLDDLTGLLSKKEYDRLARIKIGSSMRTKIPISIIMLDIDKFKDINDTYGHLGGDKVLATVGAICKAVPRRKTDIIARYGGEEIIALLEDTTADGAFMFAEKLRLAIMNGTIETMKIIKSDADLNPRRGKKFISASLGIATYPAHFFSFKDKNLTNAQEVLQTLKSKADQALYIAKETGRNNSVLWSKEVEAQLKQTRQFKSLKE